MKRVVEVLIIVSTLAAIASTFFLYRSHIFSPKQTASVIEASIPNGEEVVAQVVDTETVTPPSISSQPTSGEASKESVVSVTEKTIVIEKLPITASDVETLTSQIHSLTNLSRSQNNLPKLTLDTTLSEIAKKRSEEMIDKNYFSHTSPNGCTIDCHMKSLDYHTLTWGENLALSNNYHLYSLPELAETFLSNWLKSSAHRDNLLSKKFTHHGIGIASAGERIVITVVFAAPQ